MFHHINSVWPVTVQSNWPVWAHRHSAHELPACWVLGPAGAAPGHDCSAASQSGTLEGEASGRAGGWCVSDWPYRETEEIFKRYSTSPVHFMSMQLVFLCTDFTDHLIHTHPSYTQRASREQAPNGKDVRHLRVFSTLHLEMQESQFIYYAKALFQYIAYRR